MVVGFGVVKVLGWALVLHLGIVPCAQPEATPLQQMTIRVQQVATEPECTARVREQDALTRPLVMALQHQEGVCQILRWQCLPQLGNEVPRKE